MIFFFWCTIYTLIIIYSPVQVSKTLNSKSLLLAYLEVIVADMYICCPRGGSNELREEPWEPWGSWDTGLHVSLKHNDLTYWWNVKCLLYRASNCDMMYKKKSDRLHYYTVVLLFVLGPVLLKLVNIEQSRYLFLSKKGSGFFLRHFSGSFCIHSSSCHQHPS